MRIQSSADISGALTRGMEEGGLVLGEEDLPPSFFDLRSGLAGELFQRFVTYQVPLALVVRKPAAHGARFGELAFTSEAQIEKAVAGAKQSATRAARIERCIPRILAGLGLNDPQVRRDDAVPR